MRKQDCGSVWSTALCRTGSRRLLVGILVAGIWGCGGGGGGDATAPQQPASSVEIAPSAVALQPGQSTQLSATARKADGTALPGRTAVWASGNTSIATVSSTGTVTAVSDGVASITATIGGASGTATVTVKTLVATVVVTPATAQLTVGRSPVQLSAEARSSNGSALSGRAITWSSSAPAVATVSATGLVTAVSAGTATISATSEGISGTAAISVAPDPCTVVRLMTLGQTASGAFSAADCMLSDSTALHRYGFTLTNKTKVEIVMSSTAVDSYLFLVDTAFNVIDEDDDGEGGRNARIMKTLPPGKYEIIANVYDPGSYGAYQLTLKTAPAVCVSGRPATLPTTLSTTLTTSACRLNDGSYHDRYEINVANSGLYRVEVSSQDFDAIAYVLDRDERVVAQDDDGGEDYDAALEVPLEPGRYTVIATAYPKQTGGYRITVSQVFDKCAVNRTIDFGQSLINTLSASDCAVSDGGGPVHYFQRYLLRLQLPTSVQIDMTSTMLDPYLILQDASTGDILGANDDASSTTRNARLIGVLPAGDYVVNATSYNPGEKGAYQLSVVAVQNSSVSVTVTPSTMTLTPGQSQSARATVAGASNTAVNWQSSNTTVAIVSSTGVIRGVTPGNATVTAISQADPRRSAAISVTVTGGTTVNLDIAGMYVVQSVQQMDGRIPLVANRQAVVRVFPRASRTGLGSVQVRLRVMEGNNTLSTLTASVVAPVVIDEGCCSANFVLPGDLIRTGISLVADVDPGNAVAESNETDNTFPAAGTMPLTVVTVPPISVRLIPVQQNRNGQTGVASASLFNVFRSIWPLESITATARQPLVIDYTVASQNPEDWMRLVRDVEIVRQAEGGAHYYYGLVRTRGTSGVLGLANGIPARTAIGIDEGTDFGPEESRLTFAHEMGHNMGLRHSPCGGAAGPEPTYPYPDGRTGVYGMDTFAGNEIKLPTGMDIMTYCPNQWVSAYNYRKVMDFRQANPTGAGVMLPPAPVLLVSGSISASGISLDPAFSLVSSPAQADLQGSHVIEGFDTSNRVVFSWRFSPYRVEDAGSEQEAFVVAVPVAPTVQERVVRIGVRALSSAGLRRESNSRQAVRTKSFGLPAVAGDQAAQVRGLATLRKNGARTELVWSPTITQAVMVRDRLSGDVLALVRDGSLDLSQFGAPERLDIHISDGTGSVKLIVDPFTGALRK